jgi:hypothetical protein
MDGKTCASIASVRAYVGLPVKHKSSFSGEGEIRRISIIVYSHFHPLFRCHMGLEPLLDREKMAARHGEDDC